MSLRDGTWVTHERIRTYSAILLLVTLLTYAYLFATANGMMDTRHRPIGTDFSNIYAAGSLVREGSPDAPFIPEKQEARERKIFGNQTQFYGWHYPPYFLAVAAALAGLPYLAALAVWLLATGGFYMRSITALWPQQKLWLPALAFPAVFINIGHGHNGFLTAGLFATAAATLTVRPVLAGICFGLLAYKPQFGLLIPLALLAGRQYRCFAAASITVLLMTLATTALYGPEVWEAFFQSLAFTRDAVLEQGQTGFYKIQSLFAAVRLWGGSVSLAYTAQGLLILWVAITLWRVWRSNVAHEQQCAALIIGCFLATPYSLDYDLLALAPALALLAHYGTANGFRPYEKTLLALVFLCPLFARTLAQYGHVPATTFLLVLLYSAITSRPRY